MTSLPFEPRLPPFPYQERFLEEHGFDPGYAMTWEQGCGKTKSLIDNAAQLRMFDKIEAMLVLAPGGVHRNWIVEELPKHWPAAAPPYRPFCWDGGTPWGGAGSVGHTKGFAAWIAAVRAGAFGVLTMSYNQFLTDAGKDATWALMKSRRTLYIADESHRFKTPSSARQKRALASSVYAPYRRIASGTPMDKPFDLYSQVRWLNADFWREELGIGSFAAFKAHFADWRMNRTAGGQEFPSIVRYKNLDVLETCLAKLGSRVTLEETGLSLPQAWKRIFHPLTKEQRRVYDEIRDECMSVLESGELVTAGMALTMQLRLKQIGCGFVRPAAGLEDVLFKDNPRADALREYLVGLEGAPTVIWGLFRHDVGAASDASRRAGRRPVVYAQDDVAGTVEAWAAGEYDDLVANLNSTMIEGYTLVHTNTMIYYSNSPRLITRQQSEARIRRIGQKRTVLYVDFLAEGTADAKALKLLREKGVVSGTVLGDDPLRTLSWLLEEETQPAVQGELF